MSEAKEHELKPCPFCGKKALRADNAWVYCSTCNARAPFHAWNRRPAGQWTSKCPAEAGWYWYFDGGMPDIVSIMELHEGGEMKLMVILQDYPLTIPDFIDDRTVFWLHIDQPEQPERGGVL